VTHFFYNCIIKSNLGGIFMTNTSESITYLVKVQQAVMINNKECCYDEIIAQCTDHDEAVMIANNINGKIEKHTEPLNNVYDESTEYYL